MFGYIPGGKSGRVIAIAVAAGLSTGFLLVPWQGSPDDPKEPLPEVTLLRQKLTADTNAQKVALERVRRYAASKFSLELPDGKRREIFVGELGGEIDKVRLAALVHDTQDRTSALLRGYRSQHGTSAIVLPVPVTLDRERAEKALLGLKDELDRLPVDARLDLEARKLVPEQNGRLLDLDATLGAIEEALGRGEPKAKVVFEERRPKRIGSELGAVQFDEILGYFETHYDRSSKFLARSYNLRLAASKLDGHVLLPGEIFDFNDTVGPRDEANGYKVAKVIAEGELVDGIGGGTCQISGTLHGAAFFSGLDIVERYPHTRPSGYIKMGMDATVVYPTINFRIRNSFPFPVVLHETVKNGIVRAEILGPKRTRTVTLIRRIDAAIPFEEVERPDKDLPNGLRVLGQRGVPGFKLRRYRIIREGDHAVRERWDDTYPPTSQIVRVGAGDMSKDAVKAQDDQHPEYVADELLVTTQGPKLDAADADDDGKKDDDTADRGGVTRESREPGKYGTAGWTEEAGMPYWRSGQPNPASEPETGPGRDSKPRKRKGKKAKG
ncbi:MAG TPA: VanW family protein [Polyangiaceae bacterium]|jgi:vancomycin resistance protein YoaR|nr:VanW family protein [Polyangiaceae bacterium]